VRTLVEAGHGFYAVVFQPTLHLGKPWSAEEAAMWRKRRPRDAAPLAALIRARYGYAQEAVARWAADGVPLYDLSSVFADFGATVYSDSVHFRGPRGYRTLFAELERQGLLDRIRERYRAWENSL